MAFSKSDKEYLGSAITLAVKTAVEPITEELRKHGQTLFGPDGSNGLYGDMRTMERTVRKLTWVYGMATGAVGMLSFFKNKIFGG